MAKTLPLLLNLLLLKQVTGADKAAGSLRGNNNNEEARPQKFEHEELFKFPFDEDFFRQPRKTSLPRFRKLADETLEEAVQEHQEIDGVMKARLYDGPIDLDFRFNKFNFQNGKRSNFMPLKSSDFPMRDEIALVLKNQTDAVSVVCQGDAALPPGHEAEVLRYLAEIGGLPTMPRHPNVGHTELEHDEFWDEFRKVTQMQYGRRQNLEPLTVLRAPDLWMETRSNIDLVAEAVHDEYPGSLQQELIEWLWKNKAPVDRDIFPFRSNSDFVGHQVMMADLNTWAIGAVGPMNFYVKWYVGRPRPEEVAWAIAQRKISYDDGVPPDVVQLINMLNLKSPEEYTAYPEGCPRHPAWPAMHSAASSASFWIAVVLDLTPEQYCEALRVDYATAFARTCAGVHYATDNIAGLNLGQAIIADKLPDHLAQHYGSDPEKVRAKIEKLRFDWNNFHSYTCTGASNLVQ